MANAEPQRIHQVLCFTDFKWGILTKPLSAQLNSSGCQPCPTSRMLRIVAADEQNLMTPGTSLHP